MMRKEFNFQGHYKWIDILPKIVQLYSNKKNGTNGMKPAEVTKRMKNICLTQLLVKLK